LNIILQRAADERLVENEYDSVVRRDRSIDHTVIQSQMPEHGSRNRYVNVLPYDHNRVKISTSPGYVNASHICYADAPNALEFNYIAAQGPLNTTVEEFWRMCLEQVGQIAVALWAAKHEGCPRCRAHGSVRGRGCAWH
jgi:protein tyrosine phosphatase